jgi:hypothetical protein
MVLLGCLMVLIARAIMLHIQRIVSLLQVFDGIKKGFLRTMVKSLVAFDTIRMCCALGFLSFPFSRQEISCARHAF